MGVLGGWLIGVVFIGVDDGAFWSQMQSGVDFRYDIWNGVIKSFVFGIAVSVIAVFEGYDSVPTAEGGSRAITRTVVTSALAILVLDFVLTSFMFRGTSCTVPHSTSVVGFFVAISIAALLFLALKVGNLASAHLSDTYVMQARFDNIGGLKVRGPVKSAGVVVGRITDIKFDAASYEAVVKMDIDGRYRFPKDTLAAIYTSGLLGEQFIGLDVGGDEKMLKAGDTVSKTQSAVVLEKLISQFLFDKAADGEGASKEGARK